MSVGAIRCEAVSKHFGDRCALDQVTTSFADGAVVAVMGRNGAGKTTLINAIAGLVTPTGGTITVYGRTVAPHDPALMAIMGVVPSPLGLVDMLTCGEQLVFTAQAHGQDEPSAERTTQRMLQRLGLEEERHTMICTLSKGCRKRLALGCALVHDPAVLLMDEPFADIDPATAAGYAAELKRAYTREGRIAVIVTHDPIFALEYCTEVVVLTGGRIAVARPLHCDNCRPTVRDLIQWLNEDGSTTAA